MNVEPSPPEPISVEMTIDALDRRIEQLRGVENITITLTPATLAGFLDVGRQLLIQGQHRTQVIRQMRDNLEGMRNGALNAHYDQAANAAPPPPPRTLNTPPDGLPQVPVSPDEAVSPLFN